MGAGKSKIGRRLAARLNLPFFDSDHEIEAAAGETIEEIFANRGEQVFRDGERRVIARLLAQPVHVLATGGGAFMDQATRRVIARRAVSLWLRADLDVLVSRVLRRNNRPLLKSGDAAAILGELIEQRYPVYAEANVIVDSGEGSPEVDGDPGDRGARRLPARDDAARSGERKMTNEVERLRVELGDRAYDILVGPRLIERAGREILPLLRRRQVVIVSDETVARHYLAPLRDSLSEAGIAHHTVLLPPGEETKDLAHFGRLAEEVLAIGIERGSMLVALGGGVVGDVTGFAAATLLRGIDFVQIPTTLLAQVDSSVGGKTGINTRIGKNLIGAFYQPRLVLADTDTLSTLPHRELLAGYAEIVKYGLIRDAEFFAWLEAEGRAVCELAPSRCAAR